MPDHGELAGRVALVTGGTSDIGAATVLALARRGADIIIHYHANGAQAEALRSSVETMGRRGWCVQADLTDHTAVQRLAAEVGELGPVAILVNNAGNVLRRVEWTALDPPFLDRVFALNYRAPLTLCQLLVPPMLQRRAGVVINVLSTAAHLGGSSTALAYASAKGALLTLTRGLARLLAPQGVRVLAVAPGTIDTEFQRTGTSPGLMALQTQAIPLGRIGRPEEIGEVVAFMATDAASFIVGATIEVNGGLYMG